MNKQRKVLITITYNEMGIIIDTKAEEVAQPNLQPTCNQPATDCISRQAAIDAFYKHPNIDWTTLDVLAKINALPSVQPTLYGYNVEHLDLIARVLQKEDLPPERVTEALTDIGRIVAIVQDEFEEALQNVGWRTDGQRNTEAIRRAEG